MVCGEKFLLFGGMVTGQYPGNLVLSLKLPPSIWTEGFLPAEEGLL